MGPQMIAPGHAHVMRLTLGVRAVRRYVSMVPFQTLLVAGVTVPAPRNGRVCIVTSVRAWGETSKRRRLCTAKQEQLCTLSRVTVIRCGLGNSVNTTGV